MDGILLRDAIISGSNLLTNRKNSIDELNVYPVPDGDTGTNMSMTARSAAVMLAGLKNPTVGEVAEVAASAMLRGSRGNSGVILSLFFRGISSALKGQSELTTALLIESLKQGVKETYGAVMKPTEGTILTVARLAFEKASTLQFKDPIEAFALIFEAAKDALAKTPDMLPVLKKAGVVDSGGMGLVTLFEGMKAVFDGKGIVKLEETSQSASLVSPAAESKAKINFNYCTEFIVNKTDSKNYLSLRAYLESIGDSVVVVEDDSIIKVHLHTNEPGNAIQEGLKFGWLTNMKIDNLRQQHDQKSHSASEFKKNKTYKAVDAKVPVGFVSVATGSGIVNLFKELGADAVVSGGQTMNPSTQNILTAIQSVGAKTVVVLPNNKNIIMASEQAAKLADREVVVVQTKSIPEGISALISYDPDVGVKENIVSMTAAIGKVKTGLVTFAARDSLIEGKQISKDEILGIKENKICIIDKNINKACYRLIRKLVNSSSNILTIFYGKDISEEKANELLWNIRTKYADKVEINLINGGQSVYYYIISVE